MMVNDDDDNDDDDDDDYIIIDNLLVCNLPTVGCSFPTRELQKI